MVSNGISFIAMLLSFLLVFFVFVVAIVVAVIIGVTFGKKRAKQLDQLEEFRKYDDDEDENPSQINLENLL